MTEHEELTQIRRLIGIWLNEIDLANAEFYFDINKVSEDLCRQLLNLVYDYELEDLNDDDHPNFPGLDLGDRNSAKVAFQVTSRTDRRKVIENLQTVAKNGYQNRFDSGIKFMVLQSEKRITFTKKMNPTEILSSFDPKDDIIYPEDIIKKIRMIYEADGDLIKFNKIKRLLEKELYPKFPSHMIEKQAKEIKVLTQLMERSIETRKLDDIGTTSPYAENDLTVPIIQNLVVRESLIMDYISLLAEVSILWIQGPYSTGKTSIAVSVCENLKRNTIWLEFRGIYADQVADQLLNSLSAFLEIERISNFRSMVAEVIGALQEDTLLVLNDVPQLNPEGRYRDRLSFILKELKGFGHQVLVTSNFFVPDTLSDDHGLNIVCKSIPPFLATETALLLRSYGATSKISESLSTAITRSTQGHPLLIRSAARFLRERNWKIDSETLNAIFTGKFDPSTDKATYAKLLRETSDVKTVELLYRLKYIIGGFTSSVVNEIATVDPAIDRVGERLNELSEIWLQKSNSGNYLISPLIKHLDDNINELVKKQIHLTLAASSLSVKPVTPMAASSAILYYSLARDYNNAALVLVKVLQAFSKSAELFFEWGLDLHWFNTRLPKDIIPLLRVQIRVGQIQLAKNREQELEYLRLDLISIISEDGIGVIERYLANMALFQIDVEHRPLIAMGELTQIHKDGIEIKSNSTPIKWLDEGVQVLLDDKLLNGIWMVFAQLRSYDEFGMWFKQLAQSYPSSITDPGSNEAYVMAARSIYHNVVAKDRDSAKSKETLKLIIYQGIEKKLYLIAAFALKYSIRTLVEIDNDLKGAISLVNNFEKQLCGSNIHAYIIKAELGAMCLLKGERQLAYDYLSPLRDYDLPKFYFERIDYLVTAMQIYFDHDKDVSASLSSVALELSIENPSILNTSRYNLYGEAAIGLSHTGKTKEALHLLAEGYEKILDDFIDTDEFKGVVIRFGHTIMYVVQILTYQEPRDFGENQKFVVPEPGFFYKSNNGLLNDGFYFEERKYMVAAIATEGFEEILDYKNASKWAYKTISLLSELVEEPRFPALIQKYVFYPVSDRLYLQGYNILAEVQQFYQRIGKKVEAGNASGEESELVRMAMASGSISQDRGVYLHILFSVALDFSIRILSGDMKREDYQTNINLVFNTGKYRVANTEEYAYAKSIFEKIMLHRINYAEFKDIHEKRTSENKDFIYIVGCFLMSAFASPTEAANLQLTNLVTLDPTFRDTLKSFYYFQLMPYYDNFWRIKYQNNSKAFLRSDDLKERGFPLIQKTDPSKRIQKLFFVLSHHLLINLSPQIEDYLDSDC